MLVLMRPLPASATLNRRFTMTRPFYCDLRLPPKGLSCFIYFIVKRMERGQRWLAGSVVNKFRLASLKISSTVGCGRARSDDGVLWSVKILPLRVIGSLNAALFPFATRFPSAYSCNSFGSFVFKDSSI